MSDRIALHTDGIEQLIIRALRFTAGPGSVECFSDDERAGMLEYAAALEEPLAGVDRIASHPDDPGAGLADRLLLALGMWPRYIDELGEQVVVDAAALIKSQAHRYPMVTEDWSVERGLREHLVSQLRDLQTLLATAAQENLGLQRVGVEALVLVNEVLSWVDDPDGELGCGSCGCSMDDHNHPDFGGGCTSCGDCEGYE